MSKIGKVVSQGSWVIVQHVASRGLGVLVFYGISLFVLPEDLGTMGLAWIFVAVCDALLGLGMPTAFLRKTDVDETDRSTLFWGLMGSGLAWSLVCCLCAPLAAWVFKEEALIPIVLVLALRFPLRALDGVPLAINTKELRFKNLALLEVSCVAISGAAGIFLAYLGFGVWSLVFRHLISSAISTIVLYSITAWRPTLNFSRKLLKEYLSFGIPLTLSANVGWLVALQIEQAVIGGVLGPAALGMFNFAKKPLDVGGQVISSIREAVLLPLLVKRKRETGSANRLAMTMYLAASTGAVVIAGFVTYIFPFGYFSESQWKDAFSLMPALSVVLGFRMVQQVFSAHLTFLGEVRFLLVSAVFETGLYCGLVALYANRGLDTVANCMLISVGGIFAILTAKLLWLGRSRIGGCILHFRNQRRATT